MNYVCGDNRFEIIEQYKNELISATNIESSPDEMAVLDNILFRFWQMGWLKEQEAVEPINSYGTFRCRNCRNIVGYNDGYGRGYQNNFCSKCGRSVKWE